MFIEVSLIQSLLFAIFFALASSALAQDPRNGAHAPTDGASTDYALPGSPSACYLLNQTSGKVIKDSCGSHDGTIQGEHYRLSPEGVTWSAGGSVIKTRITTFPKNVLACFTHSFGEVRYGDDVTRVFEKYPSLLTSDAPGSGAITLEGQDSDQQKLNSANLGFLYFTEGDQEQKKYVAATTDGTNGGPHCIILARTHSGGDKFYLDGDLMGMTYDASTAEGNLGGGHLVIGGKSDDPDFWFNGTLHILVLWDDEIFANPSAVNKAMSWANNQLRLKGLPTAGSLPAHKNDLQSRFIIVGDSITECAGVDAAAGKNCWARNARVHNPEVTTVPVAMGGLSGQFAAISSPWREATLLDPRAPFNVAQFYYGINDGCRNHFSEDQVWQRAVQWSRYMHTLGVRTLFTTMIDIANAGGCGPNNESGATFKKNLNRIARTNYKGVFDGIVDFASDPELGADDSSLGRCFGPDHVHPNANCQDKMIQITEDSANYVLGAVPTTMTTAAYAMHGGDKTVVVPPSFRTNSTITLPSCYGKTGMSYSIVNGLMPLTKLTVTLAPKAGESLFNVENASLMVLPGTAMTLAPMVSNPAAAGCTWIRMR